MSERPDATPPPDGGAPGGAPSLQGPMAPRGHGPFAIFLFWGGGSFAFFSVAFELNYGSGITLICSGLLAVMAAASVYGATAFYGINISRALILLKPGQKFSFFRISILFYLLLAAVNAVVGKLMISGFSVKLNQELSGDNLLYDSNVPFSEMLTFLVIMLFPVTLHYLLVAVGIAAHSRQMQDQE